MRKPLCQVRKSHFADFMIHFPFGGMCTVENSEFLSPSRIEISVYQIFCRMKGNLRFRKCQVWELNLEYSPLKAFSLSHHNLMHTPGD